MAKVSKSPSIEALRADVLKAWMVSVLSISFNHSLHPPKGTILKRARCFYHVAPTVANLSDVERGALWVSWGPDQNCPRNTVKLLGVSQAPPQVVSDDACDSVSMLQLGGKLEVEVGGVSGERSNDQFRINSTMFGPGLFQAISEGKTLWIVYHACLDEAIFEASYWRSSQLFFKYNSKAIAERRTEYVTGYSELREILTNSPKAELQRQENHSFQRHFGANFTQLLGKGELVSD